MMDRKEAIKWLRYCAENHCENCAYENYPIEWCSAKMKECVDAVEEALSAEPTDLISRAEVLNRIKALDSIPWGGERGNAVKLVGSTEEVKRLVEKAPSAEQVTGKLNNPCDSLLKADSESCKEQKSKLDLISRADAIKAIESRQTEQWIDADVDYNNGLESAVAEIKALPSADRPSGEWVYNNKSGTFKVFTCSECGLNVESDMWCYCPNCGAKMGSDTR